MKHLTLATLIALLATFGASAFALDEPPPVIQPEDALRHAGQLRAEASAHREMERQLAAQTGGSRRERQWRKTMVALCREYSATADRTAEAYERAATANTTSAWMELRAHATPPVRPRHTTRRIRCASSPRAKHGCSTRRSPGRGAATRIVW